jgi:hypothetical protein
MNAARIVTPTLLLKEFNGAGFILTGHWDFSDQPGFFQFGPMPF